MADLIAGVGVAFEAVGNEEVVFLRNVVEKRVVANDGLQRVGELAGGFDEFADLIVGWEELIEDGGAVFVDADEGTLNDDVALNGGRGLAMGFDFFLEALAAEAGFFGLGDFKALLAEIELFAPMMFFDGFRVDEPDVDEGAAEGTFGGGAVAVEDAELMKVFGAPGRAVGFAQMEFEFGGGADVLAAAQKPTCFHGIVDEIGILGIGGFVLFEGVVEESVELGRVFGGQEEGFRGGAVFEGVEGAI